MEVFLFYMALFLLMGLLGAGVEALINFVTNLFRRR
jgi:hypothetical protein